jgi:hypothetical protein
MRQAIDHAQNNRMSIVAVAQTVVSTRQIQQALSRRGAKPDAIAIIL